MKEKEFVQNNQKLQPFCRARFYERLSSLCYRKLRQNYLSVSHKVVFLFLLSLCAEITLCFNAPVLRSVRINFPPAVILNTTGYNTKPLFFQQNPAYKNIAYFLRILHPSLLAPAQIYNRVILNNEAIPVYLPIVVFNLFISLIFLLIRDDRIIASIRIKLSPIKAQGPPYFEYLSTINALRIRTPYLCSSRIIQVSQKTPCLSVYIYNYRTSDFYKALSSLLSWPQPSPYSEFKSHKSNYQNSCLYFSQALLFSRASRTRKIIFKFRKEVMRLKIKPG